MRIKLTQDVMEPTGIKVVRHQGRRAVVFEKDVVIDMSESSARKYIDAGLGVEVKDDAAPK